MVLAKTQHLSMRLLVILLFLCSCNVVSKTVTVTNSNDDSTVTSLHQTVRNYVDSNVSIQRNNGSWSRTIMYPSISNPQQGIIVVETGNYNRDNTTIEVKRRYDNYNVYHHINVTHTRNVTVTTTKSKRFAWVSFALLAVGGIAAFLATRYPWYVSLIIAFLQSIFKRKKQS